jgi:undecaprenyl diphosphate synthase
MTGTDGAVEIDPDRVPAHVAIIMDGNGRWAGERGLPRQAGHEAGEHALFDTVEGALELGIRWLTVYAFSTENRDLLRRRTGELDDRRVRIRFIGRQTRPIPGSLRRLMADSEARTSHHRRMTLQIAFNYGGRAELADAARELAREAVAGELDPDKIDESAVERHLYTADAPDVDLLIRTSGEQRLSNYLPWQAAYAELVFTPLYWPDFDRHALRAAVADYQQRTRRFGRV